MFRTRDFILLTSVIGFLLIAITLTFVSSVSAPSGPDLLFVDTATSTTASYNAVAEVPPDERESRLEQMRRKLADIVINISVPEIVEEVLAPSQTDTSTTTAVASIQTIDLCPAQRAQAAFPTSPLLYGEVENQRVFYTNLPDVMVGTSTEQTFTKQIALRLPARTQALSFSTCIASAVVAVTPTGLPIRNTDYLQFLNQPEGTLIGYTIDGFELYSRSIIATDSCGGVSIGGVYRYYLSQNRAGVIGCFMGIPAVL